MLASMINEQMRLGHCVRWPPAGRAGFCESEVTFIIKRVSLVNVDAGSNGFHYNIINDVDLHGFHFIPTNECNNTLDV